MRQRPIATPACGPTNACHAVQNVAHPRLPCSWTSTYQKGHSVCCPIAVTDQLYRMARSCEGSCNPARHGKRQIPRVDLGGRIRGASRTLNMPASGATAFIIHARDIKLNLRSRLPRAFSPLRSIVAACWSGWLPRGQGAARLIVRLMRCPRLPLLTRAGHIKLNLRTRLPRRPATLRSSPAACAILTVLSTGAALTVRGWCVWPAL